MIERTRPLLPALAAALLLAGCGSTVASVPSPTPTEPRAAASTPTPVATPTPRPSPVVTDPAGVAGVVRATVTAGNPRLLPAYLPPGMSAAVVASNDTYKVTYTDDLHTREVVLAVAAGVQLVPVTGGHGSSAHIQFRGIRTLYTIFDTTSPTSMLRLYWGEPGTWSPAPPDGIIGPGGDVGPGIEYLLVASGITEAEFFRVANSLEPVS